jgi:acyl-ACP thioesterase
MKNSLELYFPLRTCDFDRYSRILPGAVLDVFQEVAGAHASELGIGFDEMLKKDLMWVITKVKFKILKQPETHTTVKVLTWPLAPSKLTLQREYEMYSDKGELLIKGSSEWVFMHSVLRKFVPATDAYPPIEFIDKKAFEGKFSKIPKCEFENSFVTVKPQFCDIDLNGHVNNTKYSNFVLNEICPEENEVISALQIDYHREVKPGDELRLFLKREDSCVFACGENNEETLFSCKIDFK